MIQTYTGKPFNPLAGENEDCGPIELMDIAHALSHLGDMVRPIKQRMPEFKTIEDRLLLRIAKRFDLVWPIPDVVFDADDIVLATEFRDLMNAPPQSPLRMPPFPVAIPQHIGSPEVIRELFMTRAASLGLT